ncbi:MULTISPECIES: sulfotransferase family 2 domain-containing protein [Acidithiobacillus]|uniref:sulfotransferase family 2 domain-containing protein n=1 Tax=Acidithiobacillus TaxID=119977 RepID=UPI00017F752D|nr:MULTISPECIES: sulfotransferase family 2 domain-containing protein [Acidithiobacillus]MBN6746982.1 sulfotransferase family 2 domain-containing protein [Acidithiobacillus sp. PG05]MCL4526780.1 sulfotransferase family protein [Gammaproteobacteria bacterium]MDA8376019.1 sulfotransferase family 2 domain-containing protein [Planctomycetia bacterium]ACH83979.1 hypothetical protein Lferr_1758 [Acidithiobacillus ferrooxidans ATCC 53993]MBN6744044.1 sulfotransferase family 2 domain-containing protein
MYFDQSKRLLFIHNPKTGGSSIRRILSLHDHGNARFIHVSTYELKDCILQELWDQYFIFAMVRNPWQRIVSLYYYHRSVGYARWAGLTDHHLLARYYNFSEWMDFNLKHEKSIWFGIPQNIWIDGVPNVGMYESFDDFISSICQKFDVVYENIVVNKGEADQSTYKDHFVKQEHIDYIGKIDHVIIDRFGYSF